MSRNTATPRRTPFQRLIRSKFGSPRACGRLRSMVSAGLLLLGAILPSSSSGAVVTWPVDRGGNGHAYEFVNDFVVWPDARAGAEARTPPEGFMPGTLACILSGAENQFLVDEFPQSAWMGFTDELVEGEWRWIDGTPGVWQDPDNFASAVQTLYVNWATGEPSNASGDLTENYGLTMRNAAGQWNDGVGGPGGSPAPYLVEYAPVPEPSTFAMTASLFFLGAYGCLRMSDRRKRRGRLPERRLPVL